MKKVIGIIAALSLVFTLAACQSTGSNPSGNPAGSPGSAAPEQPSSQPPATNTPDEPEKWVPSEALTLVVHNDAGSGTDTIYRAWAAAAEKELGVSVVISNIGGGAFIPAMTEIAEAAPDGYTIGCITESPYYSSGYMGEYSVDLFNDIDVLFQGVKNFNMLAVPADAPYDTLEGFIQYCKDHPDENITLGNSGTGGIHDITIKALAKAAGLSNITSVAYGGAADSAAAVAGGHITGHVAGYSPNRSLIESGHIKVIGTFKDGADRDERFPDWESAVEIGYDVTGLQIWGICLPAGTPDNIRTAIKEAFTSALEDEEFKTVVENQGMLIDYVEGDEYLKELQNVYDTAAQFSESQ